MSKDILLRPSEIVERYPKIAKHYNARELGYLLQLKLIKGRKASRTSYLSVNSIRKLIKFKENHVLNIPT